MGAPPVLLTALLLFLPGFSHCQLHTLIAPNVFRVESEETIILESHEYGSEIKVDILLQDFPKKTKVYTQTQVTLNAANNFLVETKMKLPASHIDQNPKQRQFVSLVAKCTAFNLEKVILISFDSGFIFVQSDKPLYTPTDKVFYRLFAVNHQLTPSPAAVTVDFVNPDNIIVKRQVLSASDKSGIISSSFDIPGIVK
ncbi:complement C3-like [Protopterus annectens]|uniref:complement C3-like n=1 Tax=Protopterus annectens TaxID=7888 RepID=UPI001CFB99CD|nr:complement C3-like [Protopterus annectens]